MSNILKFVNDYTKPFDSINHLFQGIFIYSKLRHHERNDIYLIQEAIYEITELYLPIEELKLWLSINFQLFKSSTF